MAESRKKESKVSSERRGATVAKQRRYGVLNVEQAKQIASRYLFDIKLESVTAFGLPEVDDRYHVWRVPILASSGDRVGEVVIDARTSIIQTDRTTKVENIESRLLKKREESGDFAVEASSGVPGGNAHNLRNVIALGEADVMLEDLPPESVDLVFTSPP